MRTYSYRIRDVAYGAGIIFALGLPAHATTQNYQYKDNLSSTFNIQMFQCNVAPYYCTSMVIENSSGTEIFTSSNPGQVTVPSWAGSTLGPITTYGTSPGAVLVPSVNAFVTNAGPNGAHNIANSPTVNIANDQLTATGAAPPASAFYLGANGSGATGGQLHGLINCDSHGFKHITSSTDTLAVQGVSSQAIYICGYVSRANGVVAWYLEDTASTNANCSSSLTQLIGVANEIAASGEVVKSPFWDGLKNTSGHGLCINTVGTGGVDIDFWYAQF